MRSRNAGKMAVVGWMVLAGLPGEPAGAQGPAGPGETEAPTLEQVIDGIERMETRFFESQSLLLRFERTKSEDLMPTTASGGLLPAEWVLAYRGDKWFNERRFTHPMRTKTLQVPAKPMTQVIKDRFLVEWRQETDSAVVDNFDVGRNFYAGLYYTRNLSLDAPKYIAKANGADIAAIRKQPSTADDVDLPFLPEFLRANRAHYRVSASPEDVDGARCWVVEWPGMDRFWVDPNRGFTVPRRAYSWGPGKPLRFEFRNRDYREVKPGLWLPFTQLEDKYASVVAEKQALWGKVAARSEYRVQSIEFDKLDDSFFDVKLPPKTRVIDMVRQFQYTVSEADSDPFTAGLAEARRLRQSSFWLWLNGGLLAAAALAAVLIIVVKVRARRKAREVT